jgi:hypothetical protein
VAIVKELLKYGAHITKNENGMYWWINPRVTVELYNSISWKREFNVPCTIIICNLLYVTKALLSFLCLYKTGNIPNLYAPL